jgi:hypothetical protein
MAALQGGHSIFLFHERFIPTGNKKMKNFENNSSE